MTKKEIVKAISEEIGLTQLKTKEIVQKTFDAIVETLVTDGRIELRNFGVFEVKKRAARKARNPRTGDKVEVPEKFVVTFKPGKHMEEQVRLLEEREAAKKQAASQGIAGGNLSVGGVESGSLEGGGTASGSTGSQPPNASSNADAGNYPPPSGSGDGNNGGSPSSTPHAPYPSDI